MIKILLIYFCLFYSLATQANERYFVTASNGLIVRDAPNKEANRIGKIPYGITVELIEESNLSFQIKDNDKVLKGQWMKVAFWNFPYEIVKNIGVTHSDGYVFSGYLEKLNKLETLNLVEIDKSAFDIFYKEVRRPEVTKIDSLKEVEKLLGNRVKWVDKKYNNEIVIRKLENIILSNGKHLAMTLDAHFVFKVYYPSEDVIVFHDDYGTEHPISLKTGEYGGTVGDPERIIESPTKKRRLNSWYPSQDCVSYFFQEQEGLNYKYLTSFGWLNGSLGRDVCVFNKFFWLNDNEFIYSYIVDYTNDIEKYFKGSFF